MRLAEVVGCTQQRNLSVRRNIWPLLRDLPKCTVSLSVRCRTTRTGNADSYHGKREWCIQSHTCVASANMHGWLSLPPRRVRWGRPHARLEAGGTLRHRSVCFVLFILPAFALDIRSACTTAGSDSRRGAHPVALVVLEMVCLHVLVSGGADDRAPHGGGLLRGSCVGGGAAAAASGQIVPVVWHLHTLVHVVVMSQRRCALRGRCCARWGRPHALQPTDTIIIQ